MAFCRESLIIYQPANIRMNSLLIHSLDKTLRRNHYPALLLLFSSIVATITSANQVGEEAEPASQEIATFLPKTPNEDDFEALKAQSPFLRTLNLSDSLILTGIAQVEGETIATLMNRETKQTHVISPATPSPEGWRLVGMRGNQADLETMTVQISLTGGEVLSVRFEKSQWKPGEGRPGGPSGPEQRGSYENRDPSDYRQGISGDGFRGPPPPEIVEKLSKLSEETRNKLIERLGQLREQGVSSDERREMFPQLIDRAMRAEGVR